MRRKCGVRRCGVRRCGVRRCSMRRCGVRRGVNEERCVWGEERCVG